jgi:hypothetical protein
LVCSGEQHGGAAALAPAIIAEALEVCSALRGEAVYFDACECGIGNIASHVFGAARGALVRSVRAEGDVARAVGDTVAWLMPTENTDDHSVTDAIGVFGGLLDSGLRAPGGSFVFTFGAAGSYSIVDDATGSKTAVDIPTQTDPKRGTISTQFTVRWSSARADPGFVFDIQIRGPNPEDPWIGWKQGATVGEDMFSPSAVGAFRFRARLRNLTNGRVSQWSPAARVCVEPTAIC